MAKHKKTIVNLDQPYEANVVGVSGILYFSAGMFLLIVVTFGLMWFLEVVMEEDAAAKKASSNPLVMTKEEALPMEPRLQAAPGFGVESKDGFVNLELMAPQAEYIELLKQWEELEKNGVIDPKTGTVIALPIADAKRKLLEQNPGVAEQESVKRSRMMVSESSAGRKASLTVR